MAELQNPTLKGEAEFILRDLSGHSVTTDRAIDIREIQDKIRATLSELLNLEIFEKKAEGDRSAVHMYISSYEVQVKMDSEDIPYIVIPDIYVNLPNNEGIHSLYPKGKPYARFYMDNNPSVRSRIMAGEGLGEKTWYVEGLTGYFRNEECVAKDDKLTIKLIIPAPNTLKETDRLPIIPEQIAEMRRRVKKDLLSPLTPEDKESDGIDQSNPSQVNKV